MLVLGTDTSVLLCHVHPYDAPHDDDEGDQLCLQMALFCNHRASIRRDVYVWQGDALKDMSHEISNKH